MNVGELIDYLQQFPDKTTVFSTIEDWEKSGPNVNDFIILGSLFEVEAEEVPQ